MITSLLAHACPSIQYRLRLGFLGEAPSSPQMLALHSHLLDQPLVQQMRGLQQPDGWLGERFHGFSSLEGNIRLLCELGLRPSDPPLRGTLDALREQPLRIDCELGQVGRLLDEAGLGGTNMICAALYARAGFEELPLVKSQIEGALSSFEALQQVESLSQILEYHHGKPVFRPGSQLPGIYHLRLLAHTRSWRNPDVSMMVCQATRRLAELSPIPQIYLRHHSQLIAPPSFGMLDFKPKMEEMSPAEWMAWFQQAELLARMGFVPFLPSLQDQLASLDRILAQGGGWFRLPLNHPYFHRWGAYTGMRLENDWHSPQRRLNDLTFRCLLIRHYAALM